MLLNTFIIFISAFFSNAREGWQSSVSGRGFEDTRADQEANSWGRSGGNPNKYRPKNLPKRF